MLTNLLGLFADKAVTDVVVNSPEDVRVLAGAGWQQVSVPSLGAEQLQDLAIGLVAKGNRHLDHANPLADVALGVRELPALSNMGVERLRVHAVLGGTVASQTLLSLRAHRTSGNSKSLGQVLQSLTASEEQSALIEQIATSGESFLISGTPGAGKTTLLRAMLGACPQLRTLVLEDTAELLPIDGHFIGLQARQANIEHRGEVDLQRLLIETLRMNPQRIVLGEVRGAEAALLLQAMNLTGVGGACTIHSRAAATVGQRLAALTREPEALAVFDWLIHLTVTDGQRRVEEIRSLR